MSDLLPSSSGEFPSVAAWVESFKKTAQSEKFRNGWLNGVKIFVLHDTYGLPFDMIRDACRDRGAFFDDWGLRLELKYRYGWSSERIELELK